MTAKQLSRVATMTGDETEREEKTPRLRLPLPSNVIALQSTDRREKPHWQRSVGQREGRNGRRQPH